MNSLDSTVRQAAAIVALSLLAAAPAAVSPSGAGAAAAPPRPAGDGPASAVVPGPPFDVTVTVLHDGRDDGSPVAFELAFERADRSGAMQVWQLAGMFQSRSDEPYSGLSSHLVLDVGTCPVLDLRLSAEPAAGSGTLEVRTVLGHAVASFDGERSPLEDPTARRLLAGVRAELDVVRSVLGRVGASEPQDGAATGNAALTALGGAFGLAGSRPSGLAGGHQVGDDDGDGDDDDRDGGDDTVDVACAIGCGILFAPPADCAGWLDEYVCCTVAAQRDACRRACVHDGIWGGLGAGILGGIEILACALDALSPF